MLHIICGEPGKGKTALMTYFAINKMLYDGFDYYYKTCQRITELKAGGFTSLTPPKQRHTCYADYVIKSQFPYCQSYYIDGFELALPNPFFKTAFVYPYSQIFLDEAQKYYDSRMSRYLRECVYRFYQLHRHHNIDVYMTCQRLGNIDLNLRDISEHIIYVEKLDIKKDEFGRIVKMTWNVIEFNCLKFAESYLDSGKKDVPFTNKTYEYTGDIFSFYDSYGNEPVFYDGNYNRDYDCVVENDYNDSVEDYIKYNHEHMYYAPVGYWKNEKTDDELLKINGYKR